MNSIYILFGAVGGAAVKVIITGQYTMRAFMLGFVSILLGSSCTVLLIHFIPAIGHEPIVISSLSSVVTAISSSIFHRVRTARVSARFGGFEVESDGGDDDDTASKARKP